MTNKWFKAGYGEPLRRLLAAESWVESVVDFGHARQFFKDADVFPCFLVARKPTDEAKPKAARVSIVPREMVRLDELRALVDTGGTDVELDRFGADAWSLEPRAVADLMAKIRERGIPLGNFAGTKPNYGVKTGYNEAFLIDCTFRNFVYVMQAAS